MAEATSILKLKYDFPKCSICLEDLKVDLAANPCGHVFHVECITKSLKNSSLCPNCKERSTLSALRKLFYSITFNDNHSNAIEQFYKELNLNEQNQFLKLLDKNEELFKANLRFSKENIDLSSDLNRQTTHLNDILSKFDILNSNLNNLEEKLKQQNIQIQSLEIERSELLNNNQEMKEQLKYYIVQNDEYNKFEQTKAALNKNATQYLRQIRQEAPAEKQADQFYSALLMQKSEIEKQKEQLETVTVKNTQLQEQIDNNNIDQQVELEIVQKELQKLKTAYLKLKNVAKNNVDTSKKSTSQIEENNQKEKAKQNNYIQIQENNSIKIKNNSAQNSEDAQKWFQNYLYQMQIRIEEDNNQSADSNSFKFEVINANQFNKKFSSQMAYIPQILLGKRTEMIGSQDEFNFAYPTKQSSQTVQKKFKYVTNLKNSSVQMQINNYYTNKRV